MRDYAAMEAAAKASGRFNDVVVLISGEQVSMMQGYGLWLKKEQPQINAPEVESLLEYPAGFDFVYNFTQAVDGYVHFKQREIRMSFVCDRPKAQWEYIRSELETALQGQWLEFWFSKTPEQRFTGLFEVELMPGDYMAAVDITVTCAA